MYTIKKENGKRCNLVNMEEHIIYILKHCNYNFYNTNDSFNIQLFGKGYYANDRIDCIAEFNSRSMADVISQSINWIDKHMSTEN
jgi:hypothetical protein